VACLPESCGAISRPTAYPAALPGRRPE
jgi:hypothetical protein